MKLSKRDKAPGRWMVLAGAGAVAVLVWQAVVARAVPSTGAATAEDGQAVIPTATSIHRLGGTSASSFGRTQTLPRTTVQIPRFRTRGS